MDSRSSGTNINIEATKFVPSDDQHAGVGVSKWQIIVGLFVLLAAFVFWFLFTSKSVQLQFSPAASNVTVRGGIAFELGGVYLLREGDYQVDAAAELHEPLTQSFAVSAERNQVIDLAFTPLPGFLNLELEPSDAIVTINGNNIDPKGLVELPAGQHELVVSHPRYLPNAQVVDIQGKKIEQLVAVQLAPNWSEVTVTSNPAGAEIWLNDVNTGLVTPTTIEALAGEREVRVQSDGYKTHRERIFAQAGVPIELAPIKLKQADAQLAVSSSPAGAGVTVNGKFVGQTPIQLDLKSSQQHTIQIIRNGYATFQRSKKLGRGTVERIHANLVQQTGEVVVRSQPAGATLTVDGKTLGAADQILQLPIKPHSISINLDGHAGYSQTIIPKVGLTQEVKVRLLTLAEARLQALKPNITTSAGQNLKLFDPFAFEMGASRREPGRRANETLRKVAMTRLFYIGTNEVTNTQFRKFASGHDSGAYEEATLNDNDMPAVKISWDEAAAYCNWLSDADGLPKFYKIEFGKVVGTNPNAIGYRLPTEAEWAWSARTSGDKPDGAQLRFPWGDNLPPPDRQGNYADRAASSLVGRIIFGYNDNQTAAAPVGTFKPNHRGLFDMGGNVAEWTNDYYEIPAKTAAENPTGPASGEYYVIRGSSWMHGTITELRYSFRDYGVDGRADLGFRIARYAE